MRSAVSSAHPVLAGQLLEPREGRLGGVDARLGLLAFGAAVVLEAEQADHGGQREPLQHERGEDHAEREEDDQVALRETGRRRRS